MLRQAVPSLCRPWSVGASAEAAEDSSLPNVAAIGCDPSLSGPSRSRVNPVGPDTSCPCITVKHAQSEDAPLFSFPCRVEPKRLAEYPEYAGPPPPAITLV